MLRTGLALWAVVLAVALAVLAWHVIGWLLATAAIGGAAYALGRRSRRPLSRSQVPARAPRQAAPGTTAPLPAAEGSPAGSAPSDAAVRREVAAGLAGLGWPARQTGPAITAALAAVRANPALAVDTPTVLRAALASADRSQAIRPGGDAPGQ